VLAQRSRQHGLVAAGLEMPTRRQDLDFHPPIIGQ
jgi:hypothetical protein